MLLNNGIICNTVIASHVNLQNSEFVWLVISLYLISHNKSKNKLNNAFHNVLYFLFAFI